MDWSSKKSEATCRRFKFELSKALGVFWMIDKIPWLKIKEPYGRMYRRTKKP